MCGAIELEPGAKKSVSLIRSRWISFILVGSGNPRWRSKVSLSE